MRVEQLMKKVTEKLYYGLWMKYFLKLNLRLKLASTGIVMLINAGRIDQKMSQFNSAKIDLKGRKFDEFGNSSQCKNVQESPKRKLGVRKRLFNLLLQ